MISITIGILIPFFGTALGALCVFFLRGEMSGRVRSALSGFAGGIMVAASVWSLLIPAIDRCESMGTLAFLPAVSGLLCGAMFLLLLDVIIPRLTANTENDALGAGRRMFFAITLHNLPEGMAVGAVFAGLLAGETSITLAAAMVLSIGVAVQNVPEGAIVSMPQYSRGMARGRAFLYGTASGVVEPIGAAITILAASVVVPLLPFLLGFAAGAMLLVVAEELIPDVIESGYVHVGSFLFTIGFSLMMTLDVTLG